MEFNTYFSKKINIRWEKSLTNLITKNTNNPCKKNKLNETEINLNNYSFYIVRILESGYPIIYVSQKFLEISGFSAEEILGTNSGIFHGPKVDKEDVKKLNTIIKNRESLNEPLHILNYLKEGKLVWNDIKIDCLKDNNIYDFIIILCSFTDIKKDSFGTYLPIFIDDYIITKKGKIVSTEDINTLENDDGDEDGDEWYIGSECK